MQGTRQDVGFSCDDVAYDVRSMTGRERLGEASAFSIEIVSAEPVDPASLLGRLGSLTIPNAWTERVIAGVIWRVSAIATSVDALRRYRIELRSAAQLLSLRRRTKVFQKLSVPDIIAAVFAAAGIADVLVTDLFGQYGKREYITQYAETDAGFIRRLCEEEGLYFHGETRDGRDVFVLCDDSREATPATEDELVMVDASSLDWSRPVAIHGRTKRQRRAGKVTLRDYDPQKPDNPIEGRSEGGVAIEKATEIYRAPVGVKTKKEADDRAAAWLEAERAEALTHVFETSAVELAPGKRVKLVIGPNYAGTSRPEGELFVVACEHQWQKAPGHCRLAVTAIPRKTRYRLPRITPRPKISGVQSAQVTGANGSEISTDDLGHVTVRFHWDREGANDDRSSKPIRVMQPNLTDSMLVPRVGWEVICAFEDGDPDRPYVLGRTYNAKQLPPFGLPANKTITALQTATSPGGGGNNSLHIDDAAGRQHMAWNASLHKTTSVANNMMTQTVGFSRTSIAGDQTRKVGGHEHVSVKDALIVKVGSQTAKVSVKQELQVNAAKAKKVASETVLVGAALMEQVGDPKEGLEHFAEAAAVAAAGSIPVVGEALSVGWNAGKAVYMGYKRGGWEGARTAAAQQAAGFVASKVPGGDAIVAGADALGITPWSEKAQAAKAAQAAGGGTGGAAAHGAAAAGQAPGHKKTVVDGIVSEGIGALHSITTPGPIKWTTLGAAQFAINGRHLTRALKVSQLTGGSSSDTLASLTIEANKAHIARTIKGALTTKISGTLDSKAGGAHHVNAGGNLTIDVDGAVNAEGGAVVFVVGSSIVAAHSGGILLKAKKVIINGKAKQSGKATNS